MRFDNCCTPFQPSQQAAIQQTSPSTADAGSSPRSAGANRSSLEYHQFPRRLASKTPRRLARLDTLPSEPSDRLTKPFVRFLRIEAAAGIILLICALVALWIFNSSLAEYYAAFWNTPVGLKWAHAEFIRPVGQWITDGAMSLFFFLIAIEIKREVLLGELRNLKHAAFSAAAAAGGMVVPDRLVTRHPIKT